MNLTTKRMLQYMTVFAGACALSATATTTWVSDSFEAPEGTNNNLIATYKMVVSGTNNEFTNSPWTSSAAGDASKLITGAAADSGYAGIHPIAVADQLLVLDLATEGQTLARTVTNDVNPTCSFASGNVYVDTLIKFTPSEDTPSIGNDVKVAVYVDVNSNLVVHHQAYDLVNSLGWTTNSVIPGLISPTNWYRLTIQLGNTATIGESCKIYLNGVAISHTNAFSAGPVAGGQWFLTAAAGTELSTVAFQGTGAADELVVTDIPADFGAPAGILLTLVFDPAMVSVLTNGAEAATLAQVPTSTPIVINAKPWYEITSMGSLFTGPSVTNKVAGTEMITNVDGTVESATSATNTITAQLYSDTGSISTGLGGGTYPANKVALWATTYSQTVLTPDMLDDYLLNVAPATDAVLKINSITVNSGTGLVTIKVGATSGLVDMTAAALNGTLVVYTTDDLTTPFALIGTFAITVETASEVTVTVPVGDGKFIKAVVQ